MKSWGAVDWVAIMFAGALSIGLLVSVVMEQAGIRMPDDGGTTERIVYAFVGLVTLYVGLKMREGPGPPV